MNRRLKGFLVAPLPTFVVIAALFVDFKFGLRSALISLSFAIAISYGVMAVIGMPIDHVLRRVGWTECWVYEVVAVIAVWTVILAETLLEPRPKPPTMEDGSPLAGASGLDLLLSPFVIGIAGVSAALAMIAAILYWRIAVRIDE